VSTGHENDLLGWTLTDLNGGLVSKNFILFSNIIRKIKTTGVQIYTFRFVLWVHIAHADLTCVLARKYQIMIPESRLRVEHERMTCQVSFHCPSGINKRSTGANGRIAQSLQAFSPSALTET